MNKEEYYKISETKNLPLRCPILNHCERRVFTIYFNSDYYKTEANHIEALQKDGTISCDFNLKKIPLQGESPSWMKGYNNMYFSNMCPEVNLFDKSNSLFPDLACVSGDYDGERINNKSRIIKVQHFSECAEFNHYIFEKGFKTLGNGKSKKSIPPKIKALLQKEVNSECPFCFNDDVGHFQIHHIDENPSNNNFDNLIMLCPNCHSKITKDDISKDEVVITKNKLGKIH